jgi:hypothetical protein
MDKLKRILTLGLYKPKEPAELSVDPSKYGRLRHICSNGIPYVPGFQNKTPEEQALILNTLTYAEVLFEEQGVRVQASDIDAACYGLDKEIN